MKIVCDECGGEDIVVWRSARPCDAEEEDRVVPEVVKISEYEGWMYEQGNLKHTKYMDSLTVYCWDCGFKRQMVLE